MVAPNSQLTKSKVLVKMGVVEKGDRVTIYMGRVPELVIAMLACAKLGAPHSVVYGGFSVEALHARIEDAQSRVLITCDGAYLRGKIVELKNTLAEVGALRELLPMCMYCKKVRDDQGYWQRVEMNAIPPSGR